MRRASSLILLLLICSLISCAARDESPPSAVPTLAGRSTPSAEFTATAIATTADVTPRVSEPAATPGKTPVFTASPDPGATATATERAQPTPTIQPSATATATLAPPPPTAAGLPLPLSLDWQFDSNGHLTAGVVAELAGKPTLVMASLGRTVYALSAAGDLRWQARTKGPVYALAVVEGERIAAGDDAGHVSLVDGQGRRLWRHALGSRVTALAGDSQGGLLAGGWDERLSLLALGEDQKRVVWQSALRGPVSDIATLPGLAVVATFDGEVSAFDASGSEAWWHDAGAPVTDLGVVERGRERTIVVALHGGRLLALGPDGVPRWQVALGAEGAGSPVWYAADLDGDGTREIVAGLGGDEPLLALVSLDGNVLWRVGAPSEVNALTSVDVEGDGKPEILAGLASGEVLACDGEGRIRATVHAGLPVQGLVAAGDVVLALADVAAWRIGGVPGNKGGPWLVAPAQVAAPPPGPESSDGEGGEEVATLVFLGDVSPGRSMEAQLARYGAGYPWSGIGSLLAESDLAVANLEGLLTTRGRPLNKSYLIRAHPRWGQTLVEAGLDLVHLANNHALDYGEEGLDETLATLGEAGIDYVGVGGDEEEARRPAVYDLDGVRVAVLGYAATRWNGSADVPQTDRVAWAYVEAVKADVSAVRDEADVVVVMLHAGTEYSTRPSPDQVAAAHAAVDAGADLVVGHHPHVTQTIERYGDVLIVYSLGDALFDIPQPAAMRGHLLRVHATRKGLRQVELWPFWIENSILPRLLDDGTGGPRYKIVYP